MSENLTASDIRVLLRERFSDTRRYAVAEEVGNTTGYARRRLDMVVCDCYESNSFALEGIEIKVSAADLRKELMDTSKHNSFFDNLDYYSLAAPAEIIDREIIPKHWGLYAARFKNGQWELRCDRKPLSLHDFEMKQVSKAFFASLVRAIATQSPSEAAVQAAYERGIKEGSRKEARELGYKISRLERERERLEQLEKLFDGARLSIFEDVDDLLAQLKRFKSMDFRLLSNLLERLVEEATHTKSKIDEVMKGEREERTNESTEGE